MNDSEKKEKKPLKRIVTFSSKRYTIYALLIFIFSFVIVKYKLHFNIFISILLSLIILIAAVVIKIRIFINRLSKSGNTESWHDLYGRKITNISYYKNDVIINSFKKNGDNYIEEIGEINKGKDYQKTERNVYDLYLPYSSMKNKGGINRIMLFIHGGGWKFFSKEYIEFMCHRYTKYGYITATMNHTFLGNKECSIFRILDEIAACAADIKYQLKNDGFSQDDNKYEMAIGGISSGAHLSLLYGYCIKNSPIPVKFIINLVGPVSAEIDYWYTIKDYYLDNIEPNDIENALKDNQLEKMWKDETSSLSLMNDFIGNLFSEKEIKEMLLKNKIIDVNNEKYKEMLKIAKYTFPYTYIDEKSVPTLCVYGGGDAIIGIVHYSHLKKRFEKNQNKIELVYMKDSGHYLENYDSKDGTIACKELHYQILKFAKKYFSYDEKEELLFNF